jgi:glycerate kinase
VPVVAFCGRLDAGEALLKSIGLLDAKSINEGMEDAPLEEKLAKTEENLQKAVEKWVKTGNFNP